MTQTSGSEHSDYAEEHFRGIVQAAIDPAITMDLNGTIIHWNDAATALLGWSRDEAIGASLGTLLVPERNRGRLVKRLQAYQSGDAQPTGVRRFDTETLHKSGHEIPVELSIAPCLIDGKMLFNAFVRDRRDELAKVEELGRLAAIVDSSTDAIIGKNLKGIITSWNAGAERVYGYTAEEAIGKPVSIVIPDEVAGEEPELREVLTGGQKLQSFEVVRRRSDGRLIDVSISISPIYNDSGSIVGSATIERDITEERANRIALEEREEQIRLLLESTAEAIYGIDLDGNCTFCNPSCVRMLGYSGAHDLIGRNMHELIHSRTADGRALPVEDCHVFQAFWQGRGTHIDDEVFWRADGTSFPVEYWSYPIRRGGRVSGAVVTFVDISERQTAERERSRLAALVESSSDPIIGLNLMGTIESWNDAAARLFQFSEEEAVGRPVDLFVSEARRGTVREAVYRGKRVDQREIRCTRRDGSTLVASLTISPIRDAQGRHIGASVIARDISRRKRREQELRDARDAAEAANLAKSEFLANISHELRTPMNAIIGMIELSLGEDLSQVMQDYLGTARDSAQTLLYLLNDLLDFSRMEAGKFELDPEPFSLREVVDRTAKTLSLRAHEKGVELACRVAPDVPDILDGDGRRLRQVLMNLVGNAIKFTQQGEIVINARIASNEEERATQVAVDESGVDDGSTAIRADPRHDEGALLHFTVSDTGIGISSDDQQKIFAPFTQVDYSTTRRFQGTGLGLAICRELTQRMGGRIWVESEPGKGSHFHFTVRCPVIRSQQADESELRLTVAKLRGTRVLVVDDNDSNCRILDETLKQWRMRPFVTDSAEVALDELRRSVEARRPYPVVLVDALMPKVDGFMMIKKAREEGLLGNSAILMLSSSDRQTFRERCDDLAIDHYLEKPVSQSDLLDAVTRVLRGAGIEADERIRMRTTSRPLKLLVAEDTPANQKVVQAIFEKRGHSVKIADNGRDAIDQLLQSDFDAVLMDVQMPKMDGYQATRMIREFEDRRLSTMPIIAMTAHAMREDMQRCLDCGMDAYISKPLEAEQLIRLTERTARSGRRTDAAMRTVDDEGDSGEGISSVWAASAKIPNATFPPSDPSNDGDDTTGATKGQPGSVEGAPLINRKRALERMGGDEEMLDGLIQCFIEDAPELLSQLDEALRENDSAEVARAAHSLKGLSANFEALPCRNAAELVEQVGRGGDLSNISPRVSVLKREVAALIGALKTDLS